MERDRAVKFAGVAGLLFVVTQVLSVAMPGQPPDADGTIAEIRKYFVDNRSALLAGALLQALALVFFIWFIVQLRRLITAGDNDAQGLGITMVIGAVIGGTLASVSVAISSSLVWIDGFAQTANDDVVRLAWYASYLCFGIGTGAFVVLFGAFAFAAHKSGVGPAWLKWIAVVGVVGNLFGMIGTVSSGAVAIAFIAFLVFPIWTLGASICMLTGKMTQSTS